MNRQSDFINNTNTTTNTNNNSNNRNGQLNHHHHHHHHQQQQQHHHHHHHQQLTLNLQQTTASNDLNQLNLIDPCLINNIESKNLQSTSQSQLISNSSLINEIIGLIKRLNIRLVAFDFDCTIVNIHTGGQWLDSPEKLAEFVRPCFRDLIPVLLKSNDFIHTCVVTYSPQEKLIKDVLRISMKDENDLDNLINRIVIKGNTKEFLNKYGLETCYTNGKQPHLEYCRNYFFNTYKSDSIKDSNVLLIDDDVTNIKIALENGHLAYQVNNNVKLIDFYNYLRDKCEDLR